MKIHIFSIYYILDSYRYKIDTNMKIKYKTIPEFNYNNRSYNDIIKNMILFYIVVVNFDY